jgi:sec-independent protein translocase protein TatB
MFDFDIGKLMVVAIVALAVIPPKDLPRVMRNVGQVVGKMRRMAAEFQGQFMDAMREADLDSVRKELEALNEKAKIDTAFDPAAMIRDEVTKAAATHDIGTSEVALTPPALSSPPPDAVAVEANLDDVRKELEALNQKSGGDSSVDASAMIGDEASRAPALPYVGTSETAPDAQAQPQESAAGIELPAKQSAAE